MSYLSELNRRYYNDTADQWRESVRGTKDDHKDKISRLVNESRYRAARALLPKDGRRRYLDFGCGCGDFSLALLRDGNAVLGLDPSENMIAMAKAEARDAGFDPVVFCEGDAKRWPKGECFDAILALAVLFFLSPEDEALFFKQSRAALNDDGFVLCSYINKFADLVTLNEYSLRILRGQVLPKLTHEKAETERLTEALQELLPGAGGDKSFKNVGIVSVTDIRPENPFHLDRKFAEHGFEIDDMVFSRFYLLPPEIIEREENFALFQKQIELIEHREESELGPIFAKTMTLRLKPIG